ncbi:MAG: hypothetical protein GY730_07655 [bacterium]|nr:hypothetical protein [bacterium]
MIITNLDYRAANILIGLPEEMFDDAINKFKQGEREHGQGWSEVDHKKEFIEECLDGLNYLEGAKDYNRVKDCVVIQRLFIRAWKLAKKLKENPKRIQV